MWNVTLRVNDANGAATGNNFAAGCKWGSGVTATFMPYDDPSGGNQPVLPPVITDPIVTEITFPANGDKATSRWNPTPFWYFGGDSEQNAYEVSFEYFLYDEVGSLKIESASGYMNRGLDGTSNAMSAKAGYYKFYWKTYSSLTSHDGKSGQFVPYIEAPVGSKMYIWNWSVKINGVDAESSNKNEAAGQTKGEIGDPLSTYDWYEGMENWHGDPTNPLVTKIDMAAGNRWYIGEYRDPEGKLDEYVWDLEFEYFMPERVELSFSNAPGWMTILEGSSKLEVGHHSIKLKAQVTKYTETPKLGPDGQPELGPDGQPIIEKKGTSANVFIPNYSNKTTHDGTLYVWNVKVKLNGEDYELKPFNSTNTNPQAPLDASKKLKEYEWHTYMDTVVDTTPPDVTAIDFTKGERYAFCITRMANHSPEHPYEITFDYYLPEECAGAALVLDSLPGSQKLIGGDAPYFATGHHTFNAIYTTTANNNTFAPFLRNKDKFGKLYIWNFKLTIDGVEVQSQTSEIQSYISAGVDNTKRLNEYDWYETLEDAKTIPNETKDSQFMLKIENYYFDVETSQTLKDQQFRQLVGLVEDYESGTPILPNRTYVFSFDYYSAENLGSNLRVWHMHSGGGKANTSFTAYGTDKVVGKELEYDGRYHVETEFTTWPDQYDISVGLDLGVDGAGYYWNFSLIDKETGEEMLRNTELVRPVNPEENGTTFANWITNNADKDFTPNFTWLPMDSDEAKAILALKEGETLPDDEEEEEEEEEKEEKDETEDKVNPLGPDTLYNPEKDIAMDYADASGFGVGYSLDIYEYADGELAQAILEKLGDLPYKAFDIQLVFDDEFIQPEKDIFLAIALPEGFNADTVKVYFCDAYGNLIDTAAYVDSNYLLLQYDVLGTFIIVDGDIKNAGIEGDGEQEPTDDPDEGDTPADTEPDDGKEDKDDKKDKKNKKDSDSNGWILWVAIGGGVLLLAAAAVIVLILLKKKGAKPTAE